MSSAAASGSRMEEIQLLRLFHGTCLACEQQGTRHIELTVGFEQCTDIDLQPAIRHTRLP